MNATAKHQAFAAMPLHRSAPVRTGLLANRVGRFFNHCQSNLK
jgi:hypothetical protein